MQRWAAHDCPRCLKCWSNLNCRKGLACHHQALLSARRYRQSESQRTVVRAQSDSREEAESLSEEIQRRQRIIKEQLAELKQITARLSPEERQILLQAVEQKDDEASNNSEQGDDQGYPESIKALLAAAGVLDAVPFSPDPVFSGGSGEVPVPKPLSYDWGEADFQDDGQDLSQEEWEDFFQTQLQGSGQGPADGAEAWTEEDSDPDGSFSGMPESFGDDFSRPGDDIDCEIGEGVEEFLRLLEEGRPLPEDPRQAGRPKESSRSFLARMGRLRARYNAQFLKRKDWQISPEEVKQLDAQWEQVALRSDMPATMDDIQEVTPAPDIPPELERQFKRMEWLVYRLRRAYLDGIPSQPVQALASAGLLAEHIVHRDAVMECKGLPAVMEYAIRADWTHGNVELCQIWGHMSEHRPTPEWYVMVDSWLNIPYPNWYVRYVKVHFQAALAPDAFMGAFSQEAMGTEDAELAQVLDIYRERADQIRGRPRNRKERKQLESPQLMRDAYVGRPFTNQQRMRHGTLPVLEKNADVTIDAMDVHGSPEDVLKDPFADTRAMDFVSDPAMRRSRFAGVAEDPYGSGRHLLLPLFRRMQYEGSRLALRSVAGLRFRGKGAQQPGSHTAVRESAVGRPSSSPSTAEASPSLSGSGADMRPGADTAAAEESAATVGSSSASPDPETSSEAGRADKGRHSIGIKDALQGSRGMVRAWAAGRLSLEYPPAEGSSDQEMQHHADNAAPPQQHVSLQGASSSELLQMIVATLQQVKPGTFLASRLPEGLDAAVVEELAVRQSAGDGRAAKALAALRCWGVFPGRERLKPALPRPWQQELAAAAGRPFDPQAPSHSAEPPLVPWLHGSGATAAPAGAREASAAGISSSTGSSGPAYSSGRDKDPGGGMVDSIHVDKMASVRLSRAFWWRRRARRKRWLSRLQEAMQALPPLKDLDAALLPMTPSSAQDGHMELRPVAAVVEAASSFAAAADSRRSSDQTFQLLAYAPAKSASAIRSKAQAADAADTSGVASSKRQPGNCMEGGNRSLGGISTAKQADGASQPFVQAKPIQSHDSSRRLAFQSGSDFASGSSTAAKQRQGIPDLTRLMCSAESGSEYDFRKGSTPVMQGRGDSDSRDSLHERQTEMGVNEGDPEAPEAAKRPVGTAWRDGSHMTIPMTTMYELNPATGQVDRITSHWNGYITHGLGGTQQEAWDIYVRQTRLHELMGKPGFSLRFIRTEYSGAIDPDTALDW